MFIVNGEACVITALVVAGISKQRDKYADANKIWKEMTPDEKQIYRERAKGLGMSGYNLFVSEFTSQ